VVNFQPEFWSVLKRKKHVKLSKVIIASIASMSFAGLFIPHIPETTSTQSISIKQTKISVDFQFLFYLNLHLVQ